MTTTNSASGEASAPVEPTAASPDAPFFPAPVLPELADPASARELIAGTLQALAEVVDVPGDATGRPTPCEQYTVRELRDHVLGWLQFFAAAFADPDATAARPDPESYHVADSGAREDGVREDGAREDGAREDGARETDCRSIVLAAAATFDRVLSGDVLGRRVLLSQSRMDGPAALGMVLGEYLVHGWDLARALGRHWEPSDRACSVAQEFFAGTIAPEYRGGDGGFFAEEVPVPAGAGALDRLIGFAGRDPGWVPPARG